MRRIWLMTALIATSVALGACASSNQPAASDSGSSASSSESSSSSSASNKPPQGVRPPAGTKFARVNDGMPEGQVREILGEPTSRQTYQTGMAWVPFYWGSDTHRTDYKYKGKGRVVFGHNRWSGATKVIRVDWDPSEDGY